MAIGSFMGKTFTVSDKRILTPNNLQGQSGSEWAIHSRTGEKARSQWIAPKLRKYSFDLLLRAQDGVNPRGTMEHFQKMAEQPVADFFVIGGTPLSNNPFKITEMGDAWNTIIRDGVMIECKVTMTIEEYL